ncbi:hypothetical protein L914_10142 [Phytophthora nicotianae]|uniref:RxLR effector protein n=1 Tax=Phytophthora nicotianae TaxID=4792 RepID=W2N7R9_PHYNI|nr:hypothetical protein L914_10142 [Phytophthora nicotianae]
MRRCVGLALVVILLACVSASVVVNPERLLSQAHLKFIEGEKLKFWLFQKKSAADALAKLKLNGDVDSALASPKLEVLSKYLDMVSTKYPNRAESLLGTLTARYGEIAIAKGLVTTKQAPSSKDIATKLQTQQLEGWLNSQKSAVDVFNLLKIKDDDILSLISRKMETLKLYINLFNSKNPENKTTLYATLREGFKGEDQLALMISRAKDSLRTSEAASRYRHMMFQEWILKEYDPVSVLTQVFKIPEDHLFSASDRMRMIKDQYKRRYYWVNNIKEPEAVSPRRF